MDKCTNRQQREKTVVVAISVAERGNAITGDATELVKKTGNGRTRRKCSIVLCLIEEASDGE